MPENLISQPNGTAGTEKAHFAGYSVFETSRRGKYHRNLHGTQTELEAMIRTASDSWNDGILEKIRVAIEQLIAHLYSGPLGIDMACHR